MRLFANFASVFAASRSRLVRYGFINGLPGFVNRPISSRGHSRGCRLWI
jgi:hypothetical protein